jgi:hypothetical protein
MSEPQFEQDGGLRIDLVGFLRRHGWTLLVIPALATLVVALVAGVYLVWLQPVRLMSVLEFRPRFADRAYPNGTPFALSDITNRTILDVVYDTNDLKDYCSRDKFASGFHADELSTRRELLDLDYRLRIEDEFVPEQRQRLRDEWDSRVAALPFNLRLVFVQSEACAGLPDFVLRKTMTEVLTLWGQDSDIRRGVLAMSIPVVTPTMVAAADDDSLHPLLRLDGLRSVILEVGAVLDAVLAMPTSATVQVEGSPATFLELRVALERLKWRVDSLMMRVGAGSPREEVVRWAQDMAESTQRDLEGFRGREAAYKMALREFSGDIGTARAGGITGTGIGTLGESAQLSPITPQLDQSFVERLIQMSVFSHPLREQLAMRLTEAALASQSLLPKALFYQSLAGAVLVSGSQMPAALLDADLKANMATATALIARLAVLRAEHNAVAYRPAASMFALESPVMTQVEREFSTADLWTLMVTVFFFVFLTVAIWALAVDYLQASQRR